VTFNYKNLAFIDTETTGLDAERHEIWEAAALVFTGQTPTPIELDEPLEKGQGYTITKRADGWEEHHWFVTPTQFGTSEPIALEIGHFRERFDFTKACMPNQFAAWFADLTWGKSLIGAIPSFDEERIRRLCKQWGVVYNWHYHLIDIESMMLGWLMGNTNGHQATGHAPFPEFTLIDSFPFKHSQLLEPMGIIVPESEKHTALGDAKAVREAFMRIFGESHTDEELGRVAAPDDEPN
jgi:hypothetical protein